jgi:hypothetical protein
LGEVKADLEQQIWNECSRLLANSVIYYNACILSELLERKERQGDQRHADHNQTREPRELEARELLWGIQLSRNRGGD